MEIAIAEAKLGRNTGGKGYGALIVKNGKVIAKAYDSVLARNDPSCHAEMNAIRRACQRIGPDLKECTLISTCEPCPMCAAAAIWSSLDTVVFGASIAETMKLGRTRICITCSEINKRAPRKIRILGGVLRDECLKLYDYSP